MFSASRLTQSVKLEEKKKLKQYNKINTTIRHSFFFFSNSSAVKPQVTMTPHLSSDRDNLYHHWLLLYKLLKSHSIYLFRTCRLQASVIFIHLCYCSIYIKKQHMWITECSDHTGRKAKTTTDSQNSFCYRQLSHQTALPVFITEHMAAVITRNSAVQTFSLWILLLALSGKENRRTTSLQKHGWLVTIHKQSAVSLVNPQQLRYHRFPHGVIFSDRDNKLIMCTAMKLLRATVQQLYLWWRKETSPGGLWEDERPSASRKPVLS